MRFSVSLRDPTTPLWWGTVVLRWITLGFACAALLVHQDGYLRPGLAWSVFAIMVVWTTIMSLVYSKPVLRRPWLIVADVGVTCALMLTSPLILSEAQYAQPAPLVTTVWASVPPLTAGAQFGAMGGVFGGVIVSIATGVARLDLNLDVARDGVLLIASGLLIGVTATTARRSQARMAQAMRTEAANTERERLARSIHDSVLQVLARVRRRGNELGGEAAELARMAGEQEIALRALVTAEPSHSSSEDTGDLRSALHMLATSRVQVSAPANEVLLPDQVMTEILAATREALSNVEKHAGPSAQAWIFLEDLGTEIVVTVRDDGPGIPPGRVEEAMAAGRLGVTQSIRQRIEDQGGTSTLTTTPGSGTEWEFQVPRPRETRDNR